MHLSFGSNTDVEDKVPAVQREERLTDSASLPMSTVKVSNICEISIAFPMNAMYVRVKLSRNIPTNVAFASPFTGL